MMIQPAQIPTEPRPFLWLTDALEVRYTGTLAVRELTRRPSGRVLEAVTGDTLEFSVAVDGLRPRYEILRSPALAQARDAVPVDGPIAEAALHVGVGADKIENGRLAISRPGLWLVRVVLAGDWSKTMAIAAFPANVLHRMVYPEVMRVERRQRLRAIVADPRVTPETIVDAIERSGECDGLTGRLFGDERIGIDARAWA